MGSLIWLRRVLAVAATAVLGYWVAALYFLGLLTWSGLCLFGDCTPADPPGSLRWFAASALAAATAVAVLSLGWSGRMRWRWPLVTGAVVAVIGPTIMAVGG